jgi:hypothetical protein
VNVKQLFEGPDALEIALQFLRETNTRLWNKASTYGKLTPSQRSRLTPKQLALITRILTEHRLSLVFDPCSGEFGFGVGLVVYLPKPSPFPGVPDELEHVITVTCKQLFPDTHNDTTVSYGFVSGFTRTAENIAERARYGLQPIRRLESYDY